MNLKNIVAMGIGLFFFSLGTVVLFGRTQGAVFKIAYFALLLLLAVAAAAYISKPMDRKFAVILAVLFALSGTVFASGLKSFNDSEIAAKTENQGIMNDIELYQGRVDSQIEMMVGQIVAINTINNQTMAYNAMRNDQYSAEISDSNQKISDLLSAIDVLRLNINNLEARIYNDSAIIDTQNSIIDSQNAEIDRLNNRISNMIDNQNAVPVRQEDD